MTPIEIIRKNAYIGYRCARMGGGEPVHVAPVAEENALEEIHTMGQRTGNLSLIGYLRSDVKRLVWFFYGRWSKDGWWSSENSPHETDLSEVALAESFVGGC